MEYNKEKKLIKSGRTLNDLDKFVLKIIRVLEKHTEYVLISGYISILLGRARATEGVDFFIKRISLEEFRELYEELQKEGFWCLNAEKAESIYKYLDDGCSIRFSKEGIPVPNAEIKFPKKKSDYDAFTDNITVELKDGRIKISSLERHIAFKRYYLKSDKDNEDALHVEELFREKLDFDKVKRLKEEIENEWERNKQ